MTEKGKKRKLNPSPLTTPRSPSLAIQKMKIMREITIIIISLSIHIVRHVYLIFSTEDYDSRIDGNEGDPIMLTFTQYNNKLSFSIVFS